MRNYTKRVRAMGFLAGGLFLGCSSSPEPENSGALTEALRGAPEEVHQVWGAWHEDDHHHDVGTCSVDESSTQRVMTFATKEDCDDGALEWNDRLVTSLVDGTITDDVTINWHNREIFHSVRRFRPDKSYEITTDYAPPLTGVRHVVVSSTDGTQATALVDGRATRPFVPAPGVVVRFLDGKRAPEVRVPSAL